MIIKISLARLVILFNAFVFLNSIHGQVDSVISNHFSKEYKRSIQIFLANSIDCAYQQYTMEDYSWTAKFHLLYSSEKRTQHESAGIDNYEYEAFLTAQFNYDFNLSNPLILSAGIGPTFILYKCFHTSIEDGIEEIQRNYLVIGVGISASFMMKLNLNKNFFLIGEYNLTGMVTNTENFLYRALWSASTDKDGGSRSWELRLDSLKVGFGVYF